MNVAETETLIDALKASFTAAQQVSDGVDGPVALIWTDANGQWKPLLQALKKTLPQLFLLGPYAPDERQGPVIWLKCIVARTLPDVAPEERVAPILYLPKVGRQDLRAAGDCNPILRPLVELQYRGAVWHQRNGRDWTVEAFLTSDDALALDIARDSNTREAMLRALPVLAREPIVGLRGRRLDAGDFDRLAIGDPVRDLLKWMSDAKTFDERSDADHWATFRDICNREFSFDPDTDEIHASADALAEGGGKWEEVWQRFCDAPKLFPGVSAALRASLQRDLLRPIDPSRKPSHNENLENKLRRELEEVADLVHGDACDRVLALEEEHKARRGWVWAQLNESPFALALDPLGRLACAAKRPLGGATVETLIADYVAEGWRCDLAALEAQSCLKPGAKHNLVVKVVRALYEPWLDRSARRFQELLSADEGDPGKFATAIDTAADTCILFTDGLRLGGKRSRHVVTREARVARPKDTTVASDCSNTHRLRNDKAAGFTSTCCLQRRFGC